MAGPVSRRTVLAGVAASAAASPLTRAGASDRQIKTHEIKIKSFEFDPAQIEVQIGDTIRWTNFDIAPHSATADEFGWDTGELRRNESAEITVTETMETSYFCVFHPHMKARLKVITS